MYACCGVGVWHPLAGHDHSRKELADDHNQELHSSDEEKGLELQ
jgi:hypothetical protein